MPTIGSSGPDILPVTRYMFPMKSRDTDVEVGGCSEHCRVPGMMPRFSPCFTYRLHIGTSTVVFLCVFVPYILAHFTGLSAYLPDLSAGVTVPQDKYNLSQRSQKFCKAGTQIRGHTER